MKGKLKNEDVLLFLAIGYFAGRVHKKIPLVLDKCNCKPGTAQNPVVMIPQTSPVRTRPMLVSPVSRIKTR
jgi:hypothetical protein